VTAGRRSRVVSTWREHDRQNTSNHSKKLRRYELIYRKCRSIADDYACLYEDSTNYGTHVHGQIINKISVRLYILISITHLTWNKSDKWNHCKQFQWSRLLLVLQDTEISLSGFCLSPSPSLSSIRFYCREVVNLHRVEVKYSTLNNCRSPTCNHLAKSCAISASGAFRN
jgi:hypothetical protein